MSQPTTRILLVEDNLGDARLVREMVRETPELSIHHVDCLAAGLGHLVSHTVDVVLLDLGLPDSQGIATLRQVLEATSTEPVIVLTGHDDEAAGQTALQEGAQDYLVKGRVDGHSLPRAIRYAIERKRVEAALLESAVHFQTLADSGQALIWTSDLDKLCDYFNNAWLAFTGRPLERELGLGWTEGVHPGDMDRCVEIYTTSFDRRERFSMDYRLRRFDGEYRWIQDDGSPRYNSRGEFLGYIGFCLDVTDRKSRELQQALAMQVLATLNRGNDVSKLVDTLLRLIKDHTELDAVAIRLRQDEDFSYCATNGLSKPFLEAEKYLCARDEAGQIVRDANGNPVLECLCGMVLRGQFDPAQPFFTPYGSFWTNSTTDLLATASEVDRQTRFRNCCNVEGYESVALIPLRFDNQMIGLLQLNDRRKGLFTPQAIEFFEGLGASIGIAVARQRAAQARRESEAERERLIAAVEQTRDMIVITDLQGTIQYVNPAIEAVTGYRREEVLGQNPRLFKSGRHDLAFYQQLYQTITSGRTFQGQMVNRRKDGTLFTEEATISPVRDAAGKVVNYVAVKRDITEYLHLSAQLLQAQKMDSIGRLAGGVAHDFNNLLSVILGYVGLALADVNDSDPLKDTLMEVQRAGERAATLTRQLLAFSRKQVIQPVSFDLNKSVNDIEKMLRRILGEDVDLRLALAPDLQAVIADPGQIEQVIVNLAVNARDAMPAGGKLTIETANVAIGEPEAALHGDLTPGVYARLTVADTGVGMDAPTRLQIFEPFFTTKQKGRGTGLGLSMVYGIVKQSGGGIEVCSEPGKGTTFHVYLPKTQEPINESEPGREELVRGHGQQVLVVEDEAALRGLVEGMLKSWGFRVTTAANGGEALLAVEEQGLKPDLLITDVIMPAMSGAVLAERLRKNQPNLKVLFMSGYTDNAIVQHGVLESGKPFIQKPFSSADLAAKVAALLQGGTGAKTAKRVLLIDDDEHIRNLVQWACKKRGFDFVGAGNTATALEALARQAFDVLLVDMNLPGTDGVSILQAIRAAGHAAPATMFSGDVGSVDLEALRPLGVVRAVEKSGDIHDLWRLLENLKGGQ
jgi:PAS domain S-box-containing protein